VQTGTYHTTKVLDEKGPTAGKPFLVVMWESSGQIPLASDGTCELKQSHRAFWGLTATLGEPLKSCGNKTEHTSFIFAETPSIK